VRAYYEKKKTNTFSRGKPQYSPVSGLAAFYTTNALREAVQSTFSVLRVQPAQQHKDFRVT